MKCHLRIIAVIILLMFLSACSSEKEAVKNDTPNKNPKQTVSKNIRLVPKRDKAQFLYSNGIEYGSIEKEVSVGNKKYKLTATQISGLKDKDIEAKLNSNIIKGFEEHITKFINSTAEEPAGFYSSVSYSVNNKLSLVLWSGYTYYNTGLLFDLSTGKELKLADIFTEGTDYVSLLNRLVVEKILEGDQEESDILREPFTSINPDQDFLLSQSELCIYIHKNEAGFADEYRVGIPLSQIDDYVDIFDKQIEPVEKIYAKPYDVIKLNNIYIQNKQNTVKKGDCEVQLYYFTISGLENSEVEDKINKTLAESLEEVYKSKYVTQPSSTPNPAKAVAVHMVVYFNHFGYLCIYRNVYCYHEGREAADLFNVYNFDLKTGDLVDPRDMLIKYADGNETFKEKFTQLVKENLISQVSGLNANTESIMSKLENDFDFQFIIDNGHILLQNDFMNSEPGLVVYFDDTVFNSFPFWVCVSFTNQLSISPEAFLNK